LNTGTYISAPFILVPRYLSNALGWKSSSAVIRINSVRVLGYNPTSISLPLFTFMYIPRTVNIAVVQLKACVVHYNVVISYYNRLRAQAQKQYSSSKTK
jgi:hypothetical protein